MCQNLFTPIKQAVSMYRVKKRWFKSKSRAPIQTIKENLNMRELPAKTGVTGFPPRKLQLTGAVHCPLLEVPKREMDCPQIPCQKHINFQWVKWKHLLNPEKSSTPKEPNGNHMEKTPPVSRTKTRSNRRVSVSQLTCTLAAEWFTQSATGASCLGAKARGLQTVDMLLF